jgi:hypothetical protein
MRGLWGLEAGALFISPRAAISGFTAVAQHDIAPLNCPSRRCSHRRTISVEVISPLSRLAGRMAGRMGSYLALEILTPCMPSGWSESTLPSTQIA